MLWKAANAGGVSTSGANKAECLKLGWTAEEVERLHEIMINIHASCVKW